MDASALAARAYAGGGHQRAAGFKIQRSGNFQLQVLSTIQRLTQCLRELHAEDAAEVLSPPPGVPMASSPPPLPREIPKRDVPAKGASMDVVAKVQGGPDVAKSQDIVQELQGPAL